LIVLKNFAAALLAALLIPTPGARADSYDALKAEIAAREAKAAAREAAWQEKQRAESVVRKAEAAKYMAECQGQKPYPTLGMTRQEAADSRWGKPWDGIERITAAGTSHQWIYRGYATNEDCSHTFGDQKQRYLFFQNDRLIAIER
jgi:hypothetical protein